MSCRKGDGKVEVGEGKKKGGGVGRKKEGVRKVERAKREKKTERKTLSMICFAKFCLSLLFSEKTVSKQLAI